MKMSELENKNTDTIPFDLDDNNKSVPDEQTEPIVTTEPDDMKATIPANPVFGGGLVQTTNNSNGGDSPDFVRIVPTKQNACYPETTVRQFAIGSPSYLSTLSDRIKKSPGKISTGIPELDEICGGWSNGLNVVAASPGTGKTTILIQSAMKMAQQGTAVVYITNDMRELDLTAKVLSGISYSLIGENCLRIGDILYGNALNIGSPHARDVMRKAEKTLQYLHIRDLIFDENFDKACESDLTLVEMDKIERIFSVYCNTYEKVVFIADSLQQIAGYTANGKEGVDSQLRQFKQLSRKYNAPVIMVSTLNRTGYTKEGPITFSDLKESGSIEYDADLIITMLPRFILFPEPDMDMSTFKQSEKRDIILTCLKSRDSAEKKKTMTLYAPGCTFIPYEGEEQNVLSPKKKKKSPLPVMGSMSWGNVNV